MATNNSTKRPLLAKAVHMVYGFPGQLMENWEAQPIDNDHFSVRRHDGTHRTMKIGEQIKIREKGSKEPVSAIVNRGASGVLMVGNKSVIIGKGIKHGFQARALAKPAGSSNAPASYLLMSDQKMQIGRVSIGSMFEGHQVSLVDGHLLKVGEDIYPITPKKSEITLLVMKSPFEGGYLSYVNIIEIGNAMNRRDGTMGALVPPRNKGEPAQFIETFGGKMVVTARFWVESGGKKLAYHVRDGATALEEFEAQEQLEAARKIAIDAGIEPEDFSEYTVALAKLSEIEGRWQKEGMALLHGSKIFEPHDPRKELEASGISYPL